MAESSAIAGVQKARRIAEWKLWIAAALSAGLLELPFPLAGPLPAWRTVFAWLGLAPLLWAVLTSPERSVRRGFLLGYLAGILWYAGNCYWIYDTMAIYGGLPGPVSALLLVGFSLVLGLYWGVFGLGIAVLRRVTGSVRIALAFAPFLWVALELAAARITSVPWDQLGYSQVDNTLLTKLAPWTGVYGISFVLVWVNALIAGGMLLTRCPKHWLRDRRLWGASGALLLVIGGLGVTVAPPKPVATASAVLVQPNLNVGDNNTWNGPVWDQQIASFAQLIDRTVSEPSRYIAGIPQTSAPQRENVPPPYPLFPNLVVWPESPAPFIQGDPRLADAMRKLAAAENAPLIIGGIGADYAQQEGAWRDYNSAMVYSSEGQLIGRYDKIHLVPFGEYIPFQNLLSFAHKLTGRVSSFSRGTARQSFLLGSPGVEPHRYGIFICYESVFADEVRLFALNGAEVLVNISDDGWYGDTSAPWQHLNMVRMRAIENDRWILRDTNNGVTAAIDPYGRVRQSIPRHQVDALAARFGFRDHITFYTAQGDVFAWVCAVVCIGGFGFALMKIGRGSA
ncbi:MAG: apolipoprotein N-acyltransferase [Acidobacteriota bacterium]